MFSTRSMFQAEKVKYAHLDQSTYNAISSIFPKYIYECKTR